MPDHNPILYITIDNHFDPTWRRCFRRSLDFKGKRFIGYADIEQYYIDDNLELARKHPEYAFEVESPVVLREYLVRKPDRLEELKALASEGRFGLGGGAGDNIIDTNMVLGESIVRNFVSGLLWTEETLGQKSILAIRNDGFGNCSQLPQILRGCDLKWVRGLSYTYCPKRFWRGLDGSTVCDVFLPVVGALGPFGWRKYAPCPDCSGHGCDTCGKRGIDQSLCMKPPAEIDTETLKKEGAALVRLSPEELLPSEDLVTWARSLQDQFDVRFSTAPSTAEHLAKWIDQVDAPPEDDIHDGELNPNNSGCLVSRIKTKQVCRRQEYALLDAEVLACMAKLKGTAYPQLQLTATWQTLLFTMFHDAITATHVDAAYAELEDMWKEIDEGTAAIREEALSALSTQKPDTISVVNPKGTSTSQIVRAVLSAGGDGIILKDESGTEVPVTSCRATESGEREITFVASDVPALSSKAYSIANGPVPTETQLPEPNIENERFRIEADEHGLLSITDKKLGCEIVRKEEYRPNELLLEADIGSPWATICEHRPRYGLADYTHLIGAVRGNGYQALKFEVKPGRMCNFICSGDESCSAISTVTLYEGIERVDFRTEVLWDNYNLRMRVAMPMPRKGRHMYGVPYGTMERRPYEPKFAWAGANGDWPTINWAGVEADPSVALLSKGLPSYCVEDTAAGSTILLSVLRSPSVPTYLHEPVSYQMTDFDGMRDAGSHAFEYALSAYAESFAKSSVTEDGHAYNGGLLAVNGGLDLPKLPSVKSESVRLSSIKASEDGQALILRLAEFRGERGEAQVAVTPEFARIQKTNMLERDGIELDVACGVCHLDVRPWEIVTLRMES